MSVTCPCWSVLTLDTDGSGAGVGGKRQYSEEVLEPELHALRKSPYSAAARGDAPHTRARGAKRDPMRGVLRETHRSGEAGRFHGVTQAADVLGGKADAHTRSEHIAR